MSFVRRTLNKALDRTPIRYRPTHATIRIKDLVSPLRYDILIRERYFRFVREHEELCARDMTEFIERSKTLPYFVWFTNVVVPQLYPGFVGSEERVSAVFSARVRATVALYYSYKRNDYDLRKPITLRTGKVIAPTATGKRLGQTVYAGDGCHRLALLLMTGFDRLEPHMYRLHVSRRFVPRDNTAILIEELGIDDADYFAFVSLSYADQELHTKDALRDHVSRCSPSKLGELNGVLALDEPRLASAAAKPE